MNRLVDINDFYFSEFFDYFKNDKDKLQKLNDLSFYIFEKIPMITENKIVSLYLKFLKDNK